MFEIDSAYELTFDARAEINDRPYKIFFGMNEEPFTALIDEDIMIGAETASFSFGFTLSEIFPSMAFSFELGSDSSAVTFDNVRIIKVHGGDIDGIRQCVHPTDVVFPNPAYDYLKVFADEGSDIKLYNSLGIPVETKISRNINIVNINTGNLPGGVYFVEISNGKRTSVRKVIIR